MSKIKVIENFIDESDAQILINEINSPSERNPYPAYYADRNGGTAFPYNDNVMSILKKYATKANAAQKEFFDLNEDVIVTKAFGSKWQVGGSGAPHIDAIEKEPFIEYSCVMYLNDEYEGGEIYFPKQNFSIKPAKYSAIIFPGNKYEYVHGVSEIKAGERYTALYMQSTKKYFIDPDFKEC
jgi:hypothetical protein